MLRIKIYAVVFILCYKLLIKIEMIIELNEQQLDLIRDRLSKNLIEDIELREKDKNGESVNGWDLVGLDNERIDLNNILDSKSVEV